MSTRSMTLVQQPYNGDRDDFVPLYRHCDGYLAEAGKDLAEQCVGSTDAEMLVSRLLSLRANHDGRDAGPHYRLATWMPAQQGDLEHVYVVRGVEAAQFIGPRTAMEDWRIVHYERPNWQQDDFRSWPSREYSASELLCAALEQARRWAEPSQEPNPPIPELQAATRCRTRIGPHER